MITRAKISKSRRIAEAMREEFRNFRAKEGTPTASASEIAEQFGVSVPTAHNAINLLVKEGILYRVRGSGTFFKDVAEMQHLRIGLADCSIVPMSLPMQKILNCHIDFAFRYLTEQDCDVHILSYHELMNISPDRLNGEYDGFIVSHNYLDPRSIGVLRKIRHPLLIYRGDFPLGEPFTQIYYDHSKGMREVFEQIILRKDEKPIIFYEKSPSGIHTMQFWKEHLIAAGIPEEQISYEIMDASEREITCYRLVRVHGREYRSRLLLAFSEEIAINLIKAFHDEGMEPGRDYLLASTGNREKYGYRLAPEPIIASIDMPIETMAEEACKLILYLIRQPTAGAISMKIPTTFILRKSAQRAWNTDKKGVT